MTPAEYTAALELIDSLDAETKTAILGVALFHGFLVPEDLERILKSQ